MESLREAGGALTGCAPAHELRHGLQLDHTVAGPPLGAGVRAQAGTTSSGEPNGPSTIAGDPRALAAFWAAAPGYVSEPGHDEPDNASIIDPDGVGPAIGFLRVPEPKTSKNRFHIDIRVAGEPPWDWQVRAEQIRQIRATVADPVARGATEVREEHYEDERGSVLGHVVMLDPEGNEFCVG